MGKKIIRLTESQLVNIIERVIKEEGEEFNVGDLLKNLNKFPTPPKWIDTFLRYEDKIFKKYTRYSDPSQQIGLLNDLGCTDMDKCLDELNRYGYQLNKAYRRVDQKLASEMRIRFKALLDMVSKLRDNPPTNTNDDGPIRPNDDRPKPRPNKEPFRPGRQ